MERLTERDEFGNAYYPECFKIDGCRGEMTGDCGTCDFSEKVSKRLAEYEDLGVTPEQVREMDRLYREKCEEVARKPRWISVNERLPENSKPVLCWVRSTTISSGDTYIIGSCDKGFWLLQTYEIGHHCMPVKDYEVVAWMPLPEPYREEC